MQFRKWPEQTPTVFAMKVRAYQLMPESLVGLESREIQTAGPIIPGPDKRSPPWNIRTDGVAKKKLPILPLVGPPRIQDIEFQNGHRLSLSSKSDHTPPASSTPGSPTDGPANGRHSSLRCVQCAISAKFLHRFRSKDKITGVELVCLYRPLRPADVGLR